MLQRLNLRIIASTLIVLAMLTSRATAQDGSSLEVFASPETDDPIVLTLAELDALPQTSFDTSTIWTDDVITFSGVSLKMLLEHLDVTGETLEMIALNDYAVQMPLDDMNDAAPIIATRMNGGEMSVRDKGPYWVVFPYDSDVQYQSETTYSRSIWQLNRLRVAD